MIIIRFISNKKDEPCLYHLRKPKHRGTQFCLYLETFLLVSLCLVLSEREEVDTKYTNFRATEAGSWEAMFTAPTFLRGLWVVRTSSCLRCSCPVEPIGEAHHFLLGLRHCPFGKLGRKPESSEHHAHTVTWAEILWAMQRWGRSLTFISLFLSHTFAGINISKVKDNIPSLQACCVEIRNTTFTMAMISTFLSSGKKIKAKMPCH